MDAITSELNRTNVIDVASSEDFLFEGGWLMSADFVREGNDLLLIGDDGKKILITNYFSENNPPDLTGADGGVMSGDLVTKLAGPLAPGQYAGTELAQVGQAIGQVDTISGSVEVTRSDGSKDTLTKDGKIYSGDVVETGDTATVAFIMADDSTLSLGKNGRMLMDDMVYDPGDQTGNMKIEVIKGILSFVSGQIAKTDPDAMVLTTPLASLGIRGTTGVLSLPEGQQLTVVLSTNADGTTGEITVTNGAGVQVLNQPFQATAVASFNLPPSGTFTMTTAQFNQQYGGVVQAAQAAESRAPQTNQENRPGPGEGEPGEGETGEGPPPDGEGEGEPGDGDGPPPDGEGEPGEGEEPPPEGEGEPQEGEGPPGEGEGEQQAAGDGPPEDGEAPLEGDGPPGDDAPPDGEPGQVDADSTLTADGPGPDGTDDGPGDGPAPNGTNDGPGSEDTAALGGDTGGIGGAPPPSGGSTDPFGGGSDPFDGGSDPFGGGSDPFGGGSDPFGGGSDPFLGGGDPFGGGSDPFLGGGDLLGGDDDLDDLIGGILLPPDAPPPDDGPPPDDRPADDGRKLDVSVSYTLTSVDDFFIGGSLADTFTLNHSAGSFGGDDIIDGLTGIDEAYMLNLSDVLIRYEAVAGSYDIVTYAENGAAAAGTHGSIIMDSIEELFINATGQGLSGVNIVDVDLHIDSTGVDLDLDTTETGYAYVLVGDALGTTLDLSGSYSGYGDMSGNTASDGTTLGSIIFGLEGTDTLTGTTEGDILIGGADNDTFIVNSNTISTESDIIIGGTGTDAITLNATTSLLEIVGVETLTGTATGQALVLDSSVSGLTADLAGGTDSLSLGGTSGNTIIVSNTETITGSSGIDTITLGGSSAITITGGDGADIITSSVNTDTFRYSAQTDGAAAGANSGHDTITSYSTASDSILFASVFNGGAADIDDIIADDFITFVTDAAADFTSSHEALLVTGLSSGDLTETGLVNLLSAINSLFVTATSTETGLIVAQDGTNTAYYYYEESEANNSAVTASELQLLGQVDAVAGTGEFTLGA
jgi:hypothetical protein